MKGGIAMLRMLRACCLAFSMYSRIPVPSPEYDEDSSRYVFCFFPLIGIIAGLLEILAFQVLVSAGTGPFLRGAVLAALSLLLTGGIHMDGLIDTVDARSSFADRERRLEILKDPHIGAFAMIYGGLYLLLDAAAWSEAAWRAAVCMALFFAAERAASALAVLLFPQAGTGSSLNLFRGKDTPKAVCLTLAGWLAAVFIVMAFVWPAGAAGTGLVLALMMARYHHVAVKEFGGSRGDLAGWFLQSSELAALIVLLVLEKASLLL